MPLMIGTDLSNVLAKQLSKFQDRVGQYPVLILVHPETLELMFKAATVEREAFKSTPFDMPHSVYSKHWFMGIQTVEHDGITRDQFILLSMQDITIRKQPDSFEIERLRANRTS
jgi:hypothetical protein